VYELHVQVSPELYKNLVTSIVFRRFRLIIVLFVCILVIAILNNILTNPNHIEWGIFAALGGILLLLVGSPYLQAHQSWKNYPTIAQKVKYVISDAGLFMEGETYNGFSAWSNLSGLKLLNKAVVLFFAKNQMNIVPNDTFLDSNQREQVVQFIKSHIPVDNRRSVISPMVTVFVLALLAWNLIMIGVYLYFILSRK